MREFESPVDQAIREAAARGEFDNLPGAGKPIPPDAGGDDFLRRWAAAEENNQAFLPMSLQLRKEAHDLPQRVARERTPEQVREIVTDLNRRIADEIRVPTSVPALAMRLIDVDQVVADWQAERDQIAAERAAQRPAAEADQGPARVRRRWWTRRSR